MKLFKLFRKPEPQALPDPEPVWTNEEGTVVSYMSQEKIREISRSAKNTPRATTGKLIEPSYHLAD